jgi:hypothetical protein
MKIEDLAVAAENAAIKEQENQTAIQTFVTYSQEFVKSDEYANILEISSLVLKPEEALYVADRGHARQLRFAPSRGSETPFFSIIEGKSKWLTWDEVASDWGYAVSSRGLTEKDFSEAFWVKLKSVFDEEAYRFRFKHDLEFRQSEIARKNEEKKEAEAVEAQKFRHWLYKFVGYFTAAVAVSIFFGVILFG